MTIFVLQEKSNPRKTGAGMRQAYFWKKFGNSVFLGPKSMKV